MFEWLAAVRARVSDLFRHRSLAPLRYAVFAEQLVAITVEAQCPDRIEAHLALRFVQISTFTPTIAIIFQVVEVIEAIEPSVVLVQAVVRCCHCRGGGDSGSRRRVLSIRLSATRRCHRLRRSHRAISAGATGGSTITLRWQAVE